MDTEAVAWQRASLLAVLLSCLLACGDTTCHPRISRIWKNCQRTYGIEHGIVDDDFKFGWQPYSEIEHMCSRRSHVKALKCFHDDMDRSCDDATDSLMLNVTLNYKSYERAADYVCVQHNVKIFQQHSACLRSLRADSHRCWNSRPIVETTRKARRAIKSKLNNSSTAGSIRTNKTQMLQFMRRTIENFMCSDRRDVLHCLQRGMYDLRQVCTQQLMLLLSKYYGHLLPSGCSVAHSSLWSTQAAAAWGDGRQQQQQQQQQQAAAAGNRWTESVGGEVAGGQLPQRDAGRSATSTFGAAAVTLAAAAAAVAAQILPA